MSKMKKLLLPVLSALCALAFLFAGSVVAKAEMAYSFENTKIIGAQVRLDDAGMRFVLEMSDADYQAFTAEGANYSAGVLVIPSLILNGAELNTSVTSAQTIEFDNTYVAKKVVDGETTTYRFNAVLTDIPYYSLDITARGFVTDGTNYAYTNVCERTVSQISSAYYVDETGVYDSYKTTLETNILKAYNEVSSTDVATFEEITVTPALNTANSVLIGNTAEIAGYSSTVTLPENIDNVFPVTLSVADEKVISMDTANKLTGNAFGTTTVTATALGKTMGELPVSAIDTTLVKIGSGYTGGTYEQYSTGYTATDYTNGQLKFSNLSNFANHQYSIANNAQFVDSANGRTATSDKMLAMTVTGLNMDEHIAFKPRFTKEQVGLLISAGYDTIEVNVYSEVADDEAGLQSTALCGRNFISAFTPKHSITGQAVEMSYLTGSADKNNQKYVSVSRFDLNNWNVLKLSLSTLYDNWNQMAFTGSMSNFIGSNSGTYEEHKWAWFVLVNELYGTGPLNYTRTIYLDDIVVTKTGDIYDQATGAINMDSIDFIEGLKAATNYDKAFVTADTAYMAEYSGITTTTIGGRTGTFAYATNVRFDHGINKTYSDNTALSSITVYFDLGITLEQLQALKEAGKTGLYMDFYIHVDKLKRTEMTNASGYAFWTSMANGNKVNGSFIASNVFWHPDTGFNGNDGGWRTNWYVPIDTLISNYETLFTEDSASRGYMFSTDAYNDMATVYLDNIRFK